MTITKEQKERILKTCRTLQNDTRKSLRVMTNLEIAEKAHLEATEEFKKSNAAYILAMHSYVELPRWRHPKLRHRDSVQEALDTLFMQAKLLTAIEEPHSLAVNSQYDLKQFLSKAAESTDNAFIDKIKDNADEYPGKQLSSLLVEFTDYQPPKKTRKKHTHHDTDKPTHDEHKQHKKTHREKPQRKTVDSEDTSQEDMSLKKRVSNNIKRNLSKAEEMIKKKSNDGFGIFRKPSNEKALKILGITNEFDSPVTPPTSPVLRPKPVIKPKRRDHQMALKSREIIQSHDGNSGSGFENSGSGFEDITLSGGTPQSSPSTPQKSEITPPNSGEIKRHRQKGLKNSDGSGSEHHHSPRFWRKPHITENSRSKSKMSLPRMKK